MLAPRNFSYRKFKRKVDKVGYRTAFLSAAELASRRVVLRPVVDYLCERNTIRTLTPKEFEKQAEFLLEVTDEARSYGSLSAPFVANLGSGYVFTETGLIVTKDGKIANEPLFPPDRGRRFVVSKLIWQLFFERFNLTTALVRKDMGAIKTETLSDRAVAPLIPRYADNYYHWTVETVPKIRYLQEFEAETGIDVTYLVPSEAPSWLEETLELLEIPSSKIQQATERVYHAEQLILPSFPLRTRDDYQWIVDRVLANASPDRTEIHAGSNVYISRANAVERHVVNEDEVMETLSEYGFERYLLEEHTVAENVTLFNEADMIVGAHGAGLTDLIYCADATVIELFGSKIKDPYQRLAETMGVEYKTVECTAESTDLVVGQNKLESIIKIYNNDS